VELEDVELSVKFTNSVEVFEVGGCRARVGVFHADGQEVLETPLRLGGGGGAIAAIWGGARVGRTESHV
jgi:hypothetical protein